MVEVIMGERLEVLMEHFQEFATLIEFNICIGNIYFGQLKIFKHRYWLSPAPLNLPKAKLEKRLGRMVKYLQEQCPMSAVSMATNFSQFIPGLGYG